MCEDCNNLHSCAVKSCSKCSWLKRGEIIEIGDYLWSEISGLAQGEILAIGTMIGFRDEIVYLIERIDGKTFAVPLSDVKSHDKSESWYAEANTTSKLA